MTPVTEREFLWVLGLGPHPESTVVENLFIKDILFYRGDIYLEQSNSLETIYMQFKYTNNVEVKNISHYANLEISCSTFPILILIAISSPSMSLLYYIENPEAEKSKYECSVTVIGSQWFWTYEFFNVQKLILEDYLNDNIENLKITSKVFDSYFLKEDEVIENNGLRLLEVTSPLILPTSSLLNFYITSTDVLHSWALPSLGIKTDAIPGRLSLITTFVKNSGVFFGQCSEICGVGHGFMPIKLITI
jgi:heme/copper-type cytochrome/quinol oxidase subunit 2